MFCIAPDQPKRYCPECARQGYPKQEIIVLSTFGKRETSVCNLDGSKHLHKFNRAQWDWDHYEDSSEIPKWAKTC